MTGGTRAWAVVAAALAVAAAALSLWVALDGVLPPERRVLHDVQGWRFPGETLSDIVRAATTTQVVLVCGSAAAAALWLAGARREALVLAAALAVLPALQAGLKEIIDRPRPPPAQFDVRGSVTSESFPSGHVMSPTVLYGLLLYVAARARWHRGVRLALAAWSAGVLALTGVVSMWLGVHWPADIVGGYLWGGALAAAAIAALAWLQREPDG